MTPRGALLPALLGAMILLVALPARADEALADLVEQVAPSVVNLHIAGVRQPASGWDALFGGARRFESLGSGFVVDSERGWVITNQHVIGDAHEILVQAHDGRILPGRLVGSDPAIDLALVQVPGLGLPQVQLGSTARLRVGEDVVAVGNPYGHGHTVTRGILSARARSLGREAFDLFLQTDAAINPGNSGGPLFDVAGRVIGVNTAVDQRGEALAFALPVEMVRGALPFLARGERVVPGWPGLRLDEDDGGRLLVQAVYERGPAALAGLQAGDRVIAVDGRTVRGRATWAEALGPAFPTQERRVVVQRGDQQLAATLQLVDRQAWAASVVGTPRFIDAFYLTAQRVLPDQADVLGLGQGALVVEARQGSFFTRGDVILEINRQPVRSPDDLQATAAAVLRARTLDAIIWRGGTKLRIAHRW